MGGTLSGLSTRLGVITSRFMHRARPVAVRTAQRSWFEKMESRKCFASSNVMSIDGDKVETAASKLVVLRCVFLASIPPIQLLD